MKIRQSFVSNSSSCSYTINSEKFTPEEVKKILLEMVDSYRKIYKNDEYHKDGDYADFFCGDPYLCDEDKFKKRFVRSDGLYFYGCFKKDFLGKIIIESKDDNSIPFEIMDMIEERFRATHYHWG